MAGFLRAPLEVVRTVVEKRATFACTPGLVRPPMDVAPRLFACGDYLAGPYPATLEGAVRSGVAAARAATDRSRREFAMRSAHETKRRAQHHDPGARTRLRLLDLLASHQEPVALKAISEQSGLHPSTAHRILNDLTIGRYVDRPEPGSYRLGMRLLELGNLVKARLDVRDAALGPMRELHKLTHQPVNLSMRQGDEIVYVERTYSERSGMQVVRAVGGRAPLHLTSVGKLFLANDDAQRVRAYAARTGLAGHTRNSITELPRLERELARVSQYGTARDDEELELGVRCMAAGILDDQGKLVAGLSISAPADRLEESWLERLRATAAAISATLGHRAERGDAAAAGASERRLGGVDRDGRDDARHRRRDPAPDALGVADPRVLARRIEEHHDQLAPCHLGLHHQASAGFGDVAGLLQADLPLRALDEAVGVAELDRRGCRPRPCTRATSTARGSAALRAPP